MARTLKQLQAQPLLHAQNIINGALCRVTMESYQLAIVLEGQAFVDQLRSCTVAERILWHAFDYIEERIQTECVI